MNIVDKISPKTVLALLYLVIALEIAAFQIYLQIDNIVNVDLYRFGLQFTATWAIEYWTSYKIVLTTLIVSMAIMCLSLIPYYLYSQQNTRASRWSCILFPLISAIFALVSLYFIMQIDNLVNVTLYQYELQLNSIWHNKYLTITRSTLAMVETAIFLPIIIAFLTWEITKD